MHSFKSPETAGRSFPRRPVLVPLFYSSIHSAMSGQVISHRLHLMQSPSRTAATTVNPFWFVSEDTALNVASLKALTARLNSSPGEVKYLTFSHSGALKGFGPLTAFAAAH